MFNAAEEPPIPLNQVIKLPWLRHVRGDRLSIQTVYRWAQRGVRGVKLETVRVGVRLCTSERAIERFIERLTCDRCAEHAVQGHSSHANRVAVAEHELEQNGY